MSRTLVTGGTGFVGRHLVGALAARGDKVRVLARAGSDVTGLDGVGGIEVVRGDITRRADLESALAGCDRVFHAAAEMRDEQPAEVYRAANHAAVETLLELCFAGGVQRVVCTSSYFAIGRTGPPRNAEGFIADEYWTHDPDDFHGPLEESKYDAEHAVNQQVSVGKPVFATVPTMIYGPEARPVARAEDLRPGNRIVRLLAEHAAGRYAGIPGNGRQLWNLVHVNDVVAGHLAAMDANDPSGKWPPPRWTHWHMILGGENVSVNDLFARFSRLTGVAPPKALGEGGFLGKLFGGGRKAGKERTAMDSHSWAYTSAMASQDFGYRSRPLDEGLAQTVEWMARCGLVKVSGSGARSPASKA